MLYSLKNANNQAAKSRKAVLLVTLFLSSLFLSLIPAVSASHITQYAVQRDPSYISIGDLDCDGHNDIASASTMGLFITVLYNDGSGKKLGNALQFRTSFEVSYELKNKNRIGIGDLVLAQFRANNPRSAVWVLAGQLGPFSLIHLLTCVLEL